MKKSYTKPCIFFESFTLMEAIANCSSEGKMILQSMDPTSCSAWNADLEEMWLMSTSVGCEEILDDYIPAYASTAIS